MSGLEYYNIKAFIVTTLHHCAALSRLGTGSPGELRLLFAALESQASALLVLGCLQAVKPWI